MLTNINYTHQFYSDSVEGKKYAAYYPLKTFPHIAIIDPRTGKEHDSLQSRPFGMDMYADLFLLF